MPDVVWVTASSLKNGTFHTVENCQSRLGKRAIAVPTLVKEAHARGLRKCRVCRIREGNEANA